MGELSSLPKPSEGVIVTASVLTLLIALLWLVQLATLSDLAGSDAAGNAVSQAFGAIEVILLWILLAFLTLLAALVGTRPWPVWLTLALVVPISGAAALAALDLLSRPQQAPYLWPLVVPAAVPPLIVAYGWWALLPRLQSVLSPLWAGALAWVGTLLLCLALLGMLHVRQQVVAEAEAVLEKYAADYARLPADAPLGELVPFLAWPDQTRVDPVLARIRQRAQRQQEALGMLERGDFPLAFLGRFDLDPTPELCEKARALLRRRVAPLVLQKPQSRPYADVARPVDEAVRAMQWLVGHDCACDAEAAAWEDMAKGYRGTNWSVYELGKLRDPEQLGRTLREYPERFSMLTPKAHLKAWLRFADDANYTQQALAGARTLDHRTSDAVDMLRADEFSARTLLSYLPQLDLEATPELCAAALAALGRDYARIYRPRADDPRSYGELEQRMGIGEPFADLKWLATQGCDADALLSDAESLVSAYQPSPQRDAMLAELKKLHR
ncbi:MAG TPA: hypothetical protein VE963_06755 [Reyranella sp.]|nr:hypothetical protein [Reyranella sp.]